MAAKTLLETDNKISTPESEIPELQQLSFSCTSRQESDSKTNVAPRSVSFEASFANVLGFIVEGVVTLRSRIIYEREGCNLSASDGAPCSYPTSITCRQKFSSIDAGTSRIAKLATAPRAFHLMSCCG